MLKVVNVATRGTVRPYSYTDDNGNLTGFDVELLKEIDVVIQTSLQLQTDGR